MKHDLYNMPLLPLAHPDVYQLLPGAVTAFFGSDLLDGRY